MRLRFALLALVACLTGCPRSEPAGAPTPLATARASDAAIAIAPVPRPLPMAAGFASLPDRGELLAYPREQAAIRSGAYTWHRAELSEAHALRAIFGGGLHLRTPAGQALVFDHVRHLEHPSGDWTWVGRLRGGSESEQAILTFGAKATFGTFAQPDAAPLRLTTRRGLAWLVETDAAALAQQELAAPASRGPDYLVPPKRGDSGWPAAESAPQGSDVPVLLAAGMPTLDLVIGYTAGFATHLGGPSQTLTRLHYLVEVNNQAYLNSQVQARVRLVHALQVAYPDATDNETALRELTGHSGSGSVPVAAALQPVRQARDAYGADVVSLVRKYNNPENDGCGVAWLIGGGQERYAASDSPFAYSVVSDGTDAGNDGNNYFCRDETLAHELGHNLGSQHDRATATDGTDVDYGAFAYSFGYKTGVGEGNFFTIMAYGESGQARYRVFSNPRITFCGGRACGVADQADNVRSLAQTIPTATMFRATVVPLAGGARRDVDGDGRSDLVWHHPNGNLASWRMNGASVVGEAVQFAGGGFVPLATGDFDGDGRADVLWNRAQGDMQVWLGNGVGYSGQFLRMYPVGWDLVGAADADGDGRSDLLWHNRATGNLAYWIMDGASVTREAVQRAEGGFVPTALGDFNGDGRADVLWNRPQGDLQVWLGNGVTFAGQFLRPYPWGWNLVGAGDIDGDGRADLVWHQPASSRLAFWLMAGAAVRGDGMQAGTADFTPVALGDFNGDSRLDIVWNRPQADLQVWLGTGTSFSGQFLRLAPPGWTMVAGLR